MNTLKQLSIIGFAIMIALSSCTMDKRVYSSGYNIEWNKKRQGVNKQDLAKSKKPSKTVTIQQTELLALAKTDDLLNTPSINQELISAAMQNELSIAPPIEVNNILSRVQETFTNEVKHADHHTFKKRPQAQKKASKRLEETIRYSDGTSGMAIAGFICGILGLLLVIATGWPFLLGTLGTVFSAIGLSQTSKGKKGRGLAIAGLITSILSIVIFWAVVFIIGLLLL